MNKSLLLLVLVSLGAGAYIYKQEQTIKALRRLDASHRVAAQQNTGDLERVKGELADLKKSNEVFKTESAELRERLSEGGTPHTAENQPAAAGSEKKSGGFMKELAKMFTDPEMKKSMRVQQLVGIRMMYADLAKELGLSPQDAEQLMEILVDRQMDLAAASMTALESGGDSAGQGSKLTDATKRHDEQLKAVLGEEKYNQMKVYEQSMGDRWMMQQWDGQFAASGSPLQQAQKDQLFDVMREERQKAPPGAASFGNAGDPAQAFKMMQSEDTLNQFMTSQQDLNQRVLARSREFMNADQVATLEKVQTQQAELMKMQLKMSRDMFGGARK
jgi:regulator of replication initiation timing